MEAQPPDPPVPPGKEPGRRKTKPKRSSSAKTKPAKKRKFCDGPSCSLFLNELRKKFGSKKQDETESPKHIVANIVESLTNALPVSFTRIVPEKKPSVDLEHIQNFAPEMVPVTAEYKEPIVEAQEEVINIEEPKFEASPTKPIFKMPKMPLVNSDHMKLQLIRRRPTKVDAAVNTIVDHNMATEIAKHVSTLKRISLIAEEFHQKTGKHQKNAKNLKEIVDSVQEDLMKKLEEAEEEQRIKDELIRQQQMMKINEMQVD